MFTRSIQTWVCAAVCGSGLIFADGPARAVTLTLWTNNIVMPENRTFQMPITASDPDGQPLKFDVSVSSKKLTAAFAPSSNRSLLINVTGVDATNAPFSGDIVLQLFEDLTPTTTARIVTLVNSNFYDGLIFHRVIQNFVVQSGDPTGTGAGGSGVVFDDEFVASLVYDGFGQLGMANSSHDSNDSQFFITDVDLSINNTNAPSPQNLNFRNPIFGQLTSGFDVLAGMISTPVDSSHRPLSNLVMNSVMVITNSQDAVLRLTAADKFLGDVTVTVRATNAENQVATQTFQVTVITNNVSSPPFLGPIPADTTVTQNVAAAFVVATTDIDGLTTHFAFNDLETSAFPTNMVITFNPKTSLISFDPDLTLTGVVHLVIGLTDHLHPFDTQEFTLTFVPWSPTPTMTIVSLKGSMQDSSKAFGDRISVSGTFSFNGGSDHTFSSNDVLELTLGDSTVPLMLEIVPNNGQTKLQKGVYSGKARGVIAGLSSNVTVSAQISIPKGTFKISASNFNFPVPLTNQTLEVGIALGNDYGSQVQTWVQTKPGTFVPPAP